VPLSEIPSDTTRKLFIPDNFPAADALKNYIKNAKKYSSELFQSHSMIRSRVDKRIFEILSSLGSNHTIVIKPADKNLGLTIMDKLFYKNMVMEHLSDTSTYKPSDRASAFKISDELINILKTHGKYYADEQKNNLSVLGKSLTQYIGSPQCRIAPIYCLPKVHKNKSNPPGRPIVSSCSTLTYPASVFVDRCLRVFLRTLDNISIRSSDLLHRLSNVTLDEDEVLLAADVTKLYPSIPIQYGLDVVCDFCRDRGLMLSHELSFVLALLEWILKNNYLIFDNIVYLQIQGTAMGTPMAPTFANIFLTALEIKLLYTLKYRIYQRYLDDIFAVMTKEVATFFITAFNKLCPSIKLEAVTISNVAIFLDLRIEIVNRRVEFSVYQKPANIYQYIPPLSRHPRPVFTAWIKEELIRYRLKSSRPSDFIELCRKFSDRLRARGYSTEYVARALVTIPRRATLIAKVNPNPNAVIQSNHTAHSDNAVHTSSRKSTRFQAELVLALPNAPMHPAPRWRERLTLPPSVTSHREYTRLFGESNVIIAYAYPRSISSHLLRSLYTDS
jgi:hypothetical protein